MDNKNNKHQLIYQLLEVKYIQSQNRPVSSNLEDSHDIYPSDWFSNYDYETKIKVLVEALNKNILIQQTEAYQQIVEGIHQSK